ncbi:histidine-type phosphatase [Vibrio salinus]|uniref:histidine-type phosphatase n=1 Tax=Vibrio salinus TaxID=2899784 RepID=UPI001E4AE44E|nr:histidine-type phosphatase [Vibrio salinus]MCE0496153.1 histidine-type phosphatase [Vibrio salinus]
MFIKNREWCLRLFFLAFLFASQIASANGYVLEKVVEVSRHGVRPPTPGNTKAMETGTARQWPVWLTHDGELTGHGYAAAVIKGRYEAVRLRKQGVLKPGCPDAGSIFVWASPYQRTKATAKALVDGAFPGCGVDIHSVQAAKDPLFHNDKMGLVKLDKNKALSGIKKAMGGSIVLAEKKAQKDITAIESVVCKENHPCPVFDEKWSVRQKEDGRFEVKGLGTLANMAETFRLAWSNNNPEKDIAFGAVHSSQDVARLMPLLTTKYDYINDVPYIAMRGGSVLMNQIVQALDIRNTDTQIGPPDVRWLLYVAHDTNLSWLRTMLNFSWKLGDYPRGNIPPTGSLIFERWREEKSGQRFIRLYFQAQSLDQIRYLVSLDTHHQPLKQEYSMAHCQKTNVGVLCPYQEMMTHIKSSIDASAVIPVSYKEQRKYSGL